MKITFVNPYDYSLGIIEEPSQPPLGILSLTQILNNHSKHSAEVISLPYEYYTNKIEISKNFITNIQKDADIITSTTPDAVSIYTMCNTYHIALFLAKRLKELNPNLRIILGGPQATIVAEETLKKYEYIDAIGLGEGELSIIGILDALQNKNFSHVSGLAFREKDKIVMKENTNLVEDLDSLPIIDFGKFKIEEDNRICIEVGRGCPYNCTFCSTKSFWKRRFRMKSLDRIFEELLYYKAKYDAKSFSFKHDLFVANRALVMKLCELIVENNLKIKWGCSARVDTLDEELLKTMSNAGCKGIFLGIESGSERMQKLIKKNLKIDDIKAVLELVVRYEIVPTLSFIYGFPQETEEDIEKTLELFVFIREHYFEEVNSGKIDIQIHKLMYLPATEITLRNQDQLVYNRNHRMELNGKINIWNNQELDVMLSDTKIFPNQACLPRELSEKTKNLDIFAAIIYPYGSTVLSFTFKCFMEEFDGSLLKLYYAFSDVISEDDMEKFIDLPVWKLEDGQMRVEPIYQAFLKFIDEHEFSKFEGGLLKDIVDFEYNKTKLVISDKKQEKYWTKKYMYNVIAMIKRESVIKKIGNYFVGFRIEDEKFSIKYL